MFNFWDAAEDAPPPPPWSSIYVMRNGRYEPQNLMPLLPRPEAMDFDGFVPRRGANSGYLNPRPPEMRQASLMKSPVSVRRDSARIIAARGGGEGGKHVISLTFDALRPCRLALYFLATEFERQSSGAGGEAAGAAGDAAGAAAATPSAAASTGSVVERTLELHSQLDEDEVAKAEGAQNAEARRLPPPEVVETGQFGAGLGQVFESMPLDLGRWPEAKLAYVRSKPKNIPIVISLEVDPAEDEERGTHYTFLALHKASPADAPGAPPSDEEPRRPAWTMQLLAQKLQYGSQCFVLHEVFGVQSKRLADAEVEGGNTDCIICLSEPRDTAVLPCRHMCFCSYCASIVRLQCDKCPVCRQKVQSLLQFRNHADKENGVEQPLDGFLPAEGAAAAASAAAQRQH